MNPSNDIMCAKGIALNELRRYKEQMPLISNDKNGWPKLYSGIIETSQGYFYCLSYHSPLTPTTKNIEKKYDAAVLLCIKLQSGMF